MLCGNADTHQQEPAAGVQLLYLGPGEHGGVQVRPIGENLGDVGGPPQRGVVHQEGNAVITANKNTACDRSFTGKH